MERRSGRFRSRRDHLKCRTDRRHIGASDGRQHQTAMESPKEVHADCRLKRFYLLAYRAGRDARLICRTLKLRWRAAASKARSPWSGGSR
jgi:hypothetical protein